MKKVGIVTFCRANNYGAALQAYALQNYLNKLGCKGEFLDIRFNKSNIQEKKNQDVNINKLKKVINKLSSKYSELKFKVFRDKHLNINENIILGDEKNNLTTEYNSYIVGSDQVWNTDITRNTKAYFLNFTEGKKIAYAASYGKGKLNEVEKRWSREELPKYSAVSVREYSAYEYLKSEGIEATWVCDPVFLMNANEWNNNLKLKKRNIKKGYILVYYMEPSEKLLDIINYFSKSKGLDVKCVCGGTKKMECKYEHLNKGGPIDFLNNIKNAEMVITNSFHALAFSIIFEKKSVVIGHSKWNARLESLLMVTGNDKMCVGNDDIEYDKFVINGNKSYEKMQNHIEESKKFLEKSFEK